MEARSGSLEQRYHPAAGDELLPESNIFLPDLGNGIGVLRIARCISKMLSDCPYREQDDV